MREWQGEAYSNSKVEWRTGRPRDERKLLWNRPGQGKEWEGNGPRDSGRGLACRSGVERQGGATQGARFQPPVEPAAGERPSARAQEGAPREWEDLGTPRRGALYGCVCVFGDRVSPASLKLTAQTKPASYLQQSPASSSWGGHHTQLTQGFQEKPQLSAGAGRGDSLAVGGTWASREKRKKETSVTASSGDEAAMERATVSQGKWFKKAAGLPGRLRRAVMMYDHWI